MGKPLPIKQLTSWSFSRFSAHRQCPHKAKLKFIDKQQEPQNVAMARGNEIHELAENYIKGLVSRMPKELSRFADEFKKLRALFKKKLSRMVVEDTWAFTKDWAITTWDDWTGCWVRIKLDCGHWEDQTTLIISDWKTGKFREEDNAAYMEQIELYALGAFLIYEHLEVVKPRLVYLDHGIIFPPDDRAVYTRAKDLARLKREWTKRARAMMSDKRFPARPGWYCRFCHFSKDNKAKTGLCNY